MILKIERQVFNYKSSKVKKETSHVNHQINRNFTLYNLKISKLLTVNLKTLQL